MAKLASQHLLLTSMILAMAVHSASPASSRSVFIDQINRLVSIVNAGFKIVGSRIDLLGERSKMQEIRINQLALNVSHINAEQLAIHNDLNLPLVGLKNLNDAIAALRMWFIHESKGCASGWSSYLGRCFLFRKCKSACSADDGMKLCASQRAFLASVLSKRDEDYIKGTMGGKIIMFLGANDRDKDGVWRWADGTSVTATYNPQPGEIDGASNEKCLYIRSSGNDWEDIGCTRRLKSAGYVCERKAV